MKRTTKLANTHHASTGAGRGEQGWHKKVWELGEDRRIRLGLRQL